MTMPSPPPRLSVELAAGTCEPDQCEFCPAQQFLDMLDEMDGSNN